MNRPKEWGDWKWQLRHRLERFSDFQEHFGGVAFESSSIASLQERLPFGVTPYYAEVIRGTVLERVALPSLQELQVAEGETLDPLNEENQSPLPNLIHRYPNRVLLFLTQQCALYCRYCTRARRVGKEPPRGNLKAVQEYILAHPEINEVILSGGDPLLVENGPLGRALAAIRELKQVKILRISSKVPLVLPQRIEPALIQLLAEQGPIYLNLHVIHPLELTPRVQQGLRQLQQAGVILGSQTVLLKGINDQPLLMKELFENLLELGVRPYALYLCDRIAGSSHFRASLASGLEILEYLRQHCGGMALPQLIGDPPGGKVALHPQNLLSQTTEGYWVKNWQGDSVFYRD